MPAGGTAGLVTTGPGGERLVAGQPVAHVVLDALGLVLLLVSLALPWNFREDTTGVWWALLAVLVSTLTVAVPYVVGLGLIPGVTAAQGRLLSLAGAAPVLLATVLTLVLSLPRADESDYGVGSGVAVALLGVLLLALPRGSAPTDGPTLTRALPVIGAIAIGVAVLTSVVTLIAALTQGDGFDSRVLSNNSELGTGVAAAALFGGGKVSAVLLVLVLVAQVALILGPPLVAVVGGRDAGRRLLAVIALSGLAAVLLNSGNADDLPGEPSILVNYGVGTYVTPAAGLFLVLALAALALNPAVRAATAGADRASDWVETARGAMLLATGAALGFASYLIVAIIQIAMLDGDVDLPAGLFVGMFFAFLAAVAAAVSVPAARATAPRAPVVIGLAGATLVLGLIAVLTAANAGDGEGVVAVVTWPVLTGLFVMPVVAIVALTAPPSVRARFGSVLPAPSGTPGPMPPAPPAPPTTWG